MYRFAGPLLFGTAWAFNLSYVGLYMIPDIALLLALSTVPDLGQGLYMSVAVVADRVQQRRRRRDAVGVGAGPGGHHNLPAPRRMLP